LRTWKIKEKPEDFLVEELSSVGHRKNDHLVFTLEKSNWDTIGAIKALARALGVSQKRFGYGGLKDRRALTRQKVSVWGVEKERLERVKIPRIRILDIEEGDRIHLGDHRGNTFYILVRNATVTAERAKTIQQGIPNYFGVQRFGEIRPITHLVGRELIRGHFDRAVLIYLAQPFPNDPHYEVRKQLWDTGDFEEAKKKYPPSLRYERAMLDQIHQGPIEALKALPLRLTTLFIHAYQAYLFNEFVRRRCACVPLTVVEEGDIILSYLDNTRVVTLAGPHNMEKIKREGLCAAAPLVGYRTRVRGRMKCIVDAVLEEEGIVRKDFNLEQLPMLSSRGTYREIVVKPSEFSFEQTGEGVYVRFSLSRGQYATVLLEHLFS
jgi:tRNA pseudouridine13 synthase